MVPGWREASLLDVKFVFPADRTRLSLWNSESAWKQRVSRPAADIICDPDRYCQQKRLALFAEQSQRRRDHISRKGQKRAPRNEDGQVNARGGTRAGSE